VNTVAEPYIYWIQILKTLKYMQETWHASKTPFQMCRKKQFPEKIHNYVTNLGLWN
jgi:hypothetical protein